MHKNVKTDLKKTTAYCIK